MKKTLLTFSLIVGSVFFASAQINAGGVNVNIGKVCGTISGKPACINPSTGQWEVSTGNGNSIGGNVNTGAIGGTGSINGTRVTGSFFGGSGTQGATGAGGAQGSGLLSLLALAQTIIARLVPFLIGVAMLAFFWFLIEFIWKGRESSDAQAKGKLGMAYSILAIFVMVSIWGIVGFLGQTFGIGQGGSISGFKLPGEK